MTATWKNIHVAAFALLLLLGVVQLVWYFPELPLKVATNFGANGDANGWSTRNDFATIYIVTLGGTALVFFLIYLFIPRIPPRLISIPSRDYWLAPERKDRTLALVARRLLIMGNGTLCFVLLLFKFTIDANLVKDGPPSLGAGSWVAMGAYLAFVLGWMVALFWRLKPPPLSERG